MGLAASDPQGGSADRSHHFTPELIMPNRRRSLTIAMLAAAVAAAPVEAKAQTTFTFDALGYTGSCVDDPRLWSGGGVIGEFSGFFFPDFVALDIANYQTQCWGQGTGAGVPNGYVDAGLQPLASVVALGTQGAWVQMQGGTQFNLFSMSVGAGWTPVRITWNGFTDWWEPGQAPAMTFTQYINPGTITDVTFGNEWRDLRYLTMNVAFGSTDPYGSIAYRDQAVGRPEGIPYQTYFVSAVTYEVPEPSSMALLAVGAAALAAGARRRRRDLR
jgi:hypothetical protein